MNVAVIALAIINVAVLAAGTCLMIFDAEIAGGLVTVSINQLYDAEERQVKGLTVFTLDREHHRILDQTYAATARYRAPGGP